MKGLKGHTYIRFFWLEKIMPSFECEPLSLFLELETLDEKEDKGDIDGVGPLGIRITKEPWDRKGGKDSPKREAI